MAWAVALRSLLILPFASLFLAALSLLMVSGVAVAAPAAQAGADANAVCQACHGVPGREMELLGGETMSVFVDGDTSAHSVHGRKDITCTACHTNISGFPHPPQMARDRRDYQLQNYAACRNCHPEVYDKTLDSMHTRALASGNRNAAVCTDCHGAHDVTPPDLPRAKISETCSRCHSAIFEQYKASVHGAALLEESNPDVPTCIDCHGTHTIDDPTTAQFRLQSPEICGKCHRDRALMARYDISTDVFNTYVADFHGTTVTLFERQHPDQATNKAVCYDCHGIHNIKAVTDPEATVVKENLLVTCQKCHPDAAANFPASWTSHFIPDREHNPLVYYVNLFYLIFIPATLGFMVAFVSLDALHRLASRIRRRFRPSTPETGHD